MAPRRRCPRCEGRGRIARRARPPTRSRRRPANSPKTPRAHADPATCRVGAWRRGRHRAPPVLGHPPHIRVHRRGAQALVVGHHNGEAARDHGGDEQFLVVEHDVPATRIVNALVEHSRRRTLIALPLGTRRVTDQRARPGARPVVVGLEIGARHRDQVAPGVGAAVHDSRAGRHDRAQLAGGLQHQSRRFGADQVAGLTGRQRIRRGIKVRVLRLVPAVGARNSGAHQSRSNYQQYCEYSPARCITER